MRRRNPAKGIRGLVAVQRLREQKECSDRVHGCLGPRPVGAGLTGLLAFIAVCRGLHRKL